jgi:hypothetical protein
MGNSNSRIDKNYGNYEKSFDRIQLDTERINSRTALRARRKANLRMWCWALVALAIGVAAAIIHKVGPLCSKVSSVFPAFFQRFSSVFPAYHLPETNCRQSTASAAGAAATAGHFDIPGAFQPGWWSHAAACSSIWRVLGVVADAESW